MELVRDYQPDQIKNDELNDQIILKTIQAIAPLAPHLAEEAWELAGFKESIFKSNWPEYDPTAVVGDTVEIAVQINGKLRASVTVPVGCDQTAAEAVAFADSRVKSHTAEKQIVKKIYVPGRLLNIVVKS
jgi:leucyl-tRNA synthetase